MRIVAKLAQEGDLGDIAFQRLELFERLFKSFFKIRRVVLELTLGKVLVENEVRLKPLYQFKAVFDHVFI